MAMANASEKISGLIQTAAKEMIENTEQMIDSVSDKELGEQTITIMLNGQKIELNQEDYQKLQSQNADIRSDLKEKVRAIKTKAKEDAKNKPSAEQPQVRTKAVMPF